MPFVSKAQQRKCYALKAKGQNGSWDCSEFSEHTNFSKLPERKKGKEACDMSVSTLLGRMAAERPLVEKLAADSGLPPEAIEGLAARVQMTPGRLVKEAYADPAAFADLVRMASGLPPQAVKQADSECQPVQHPQRAKKPNPFANKRPGKPDAKMAGDFGTTFLKLARKAIEKKAEDRRKATAMVLMNHYLDKVAAKLDIEKQASVRMLQAHLALGKPMSHAIKVAYPQLTGERRGILAKTLVKGAADDFNNFVKKKRKEYGPKSVQGKPGSPEVGKMMKAANLGKAPARGEPVAAGHTKQANRLLRALRSVVSGDAATAARGGRAFNTSNAAGLKERVLNANPAHRGLAGREYAGNMQAAKQQAIGDRDMARAGLAGLGLGGGGALGLNAMAGGPPKPEPGMGAMAGAAAGAGAGQAAKPAKPKMAMDKQAVSPQLVSRVFNKAKNNLYQGVLPGGRVTKSMIPGAKMDQAAAPSMLGGVSPERLAATQRLGRFQQAMQKKNRGMMGTPMTPDRAAMNNAAVADIPMRRPDMGAAQLKSTTFGNLPGGVPSKPM